MSLNEDASLDVSQIEDMRSQVSGLADLPEDDTEEETDEEEKGEPGGA